MDPSDPISRLQNFFTFLLVFLVAAVPYMLRLTALLIDSMALSIKRSVFRMITAACRWAYQVANAFQAARTARFGPSCEADGRSIPFDSILVMRSFPVKRPALDALPKTRKAPEATRTCRTCGETKPLDYRHYKQMRTGGFRWSCKNCLAAKTREYHRQNPKKAQERVKRYNERKAAAGGSYTAADIKAIRTRLGDRCGYCGDPLHDSGEVEHMLPVSRGGTSNPDNLTLACRTCNGDKGTKTVENFIAYLRKHGRPVRSDIWGYAGKP
jgi:5-methylcytosine-specific restriction endonuclease McrA